MVVRVASADMFSQIAPLIEQVARSAYASLGQPRALEEWLVDNASPRSWERVLREPHQRVLVATRESRVVGVSRLSFYPLGPHWPPRTAYLGSVYVSQPHRGVGSALVSAQLEAAAAAGVRGVGCEALAESPSETFFRRLGFRAIGAHRGRDFDRSLWLEMWRDLEDFRSETWNETAPHLPRLVIS